MTDPALLAGIHRDAFVTPRPWSTEEIAALLAAPGIILCTDADAFLLGRVIADEAELLTIAVRPAAQQAGIGAQLVTEFLDTASRRGATTVFLEVAADNTAARALYTRSGFVEAGRRPRYYTGPDGREIDALILSRPLPPAPTKP